MRWLMVDANPHEVLLLRDAMAALGSIEVTHLDYGTAALDLLSNMDPGRFDLILLDWELAGPPGDQVAKVFLGRPDRDPRIPVVFTSSAIPPEVRADLQACGCIVFVKPIDLDGYDELAKQLASLCAKARACTA